MAGEARGRAGKPQAKALNQERRALLKAAGALALATAAAGMLEACERLLPTPTPVAPPSPTPSPTLEPTPTPTTAATPTPAPTPLATLAPTASAVPSVTPRPTVVPSPRPTPTYTPKPTATPRREPTPTPLPGNERWRIGHLLRRAGLGASQAELDRFEGMGLRATVDYLLDYEQADDTALENRLLGLNLDLTKIQDLQRWWLLRMIYSQRPLREKMVLFWHGLLTSGISRVGRAEYMWKQNQLFRMQAVGSFPSLLKAVSRDPAMLIWLDSQSNRKAAPNENFARELMELFSMGVGNYTERDVRESARAFTGWSLNANGFYFNSAQHDDGSKTFLGETGNFTGDDVIDIIVKQPATSAYISRRLFKFFAYDDPEPAVLGRLQDTFRDSGYSIKAVVRELLLSDAFYSAQAYRSRPKSPVELAVGMMRSLAVETDGNVLLGPLVRMGQTIFDPPNVAGWPGGAVWINSSTLLERINFANRVTADRRNFKPLDALTQAGASSARQVTDYYVSLLLDGNMRAAPRAVLDDYARPALQGGLNESAARSVVYLTLSAPDYQLA